MISMCVCQNRHFFLVGLGVAGAAYVAKGALQVVQHVKSNPELMKQAAAVGAGFRGAGSVFKMPTFASMMTKHSGGFDPAINRREAALILGISQNANKQAIKEAHRKIMLLNHPDRGARFLLWTGQTTRVTPALIVCQAVRHTLPPRSTRRTSACLVRAAHQAPLSLDCHLHT